MEVKKNRCERFWLTVRTDAGVESGIYEGAIYIKPQSGYHQELPFKIRVVSINMRDIPGIDYFMLMTYELIN